ncbi:MAG: NAD(P)/FAD-dependent oxidoreductase [Candidatus Omnitrophica bacterium]|nr:NAD(P)/FAD-dependent oxidoreductase [Candidatus Omnitrophota bacterium]
MSMDESFQTIIVGGGQAGLAAGFFLSQQGNSFVILDENIRTGESWRNRWDGLRLFTPSKYNGLPGRPFPSPDFYFPTKDEVADYLEEYAGHFRLPLRHGVKVESLTRNDTGYRLTTSNGQILTRNVIIATGPYQKPNKPPYAQDLDPSILQMHSSAYRNPQEIPVQNVLVVGAANSGAEISLELAKAGKKVWLAGRDVGRIPADKLGKAFGGRLYWWFISQILSVKTPIGRKMSSDVYIHGAPLIRASRQEIVDAGVESTLRVTGTVNGKPQLEDGRRIPAEAVIWATGFRPDYKWIDLPIFDEQGYPRHQRGIIPEAPGLYFVGLLFQTALSSALLGGVGAEAEYIAKKIAQQ